VFFAKSKRMRWARQHIEEMRNAYTVLNGKPEEKSSLERPRRR
jgi:DNA/RNA-binding domain of Phe-tRNA-synthetase-like protein